MDTCTDAYNLTDCLLQSVIDESTDHNQWDVPTFCITLVIGLVALMFPFMTAVQGFYGPGRRRCSNNAIGKWSAKTQYRMNLSEFRRDSIAYTPLLTSDLILSPEFAYVMKENDNCRTNSSQRSTEGSNKKKTEESYSLATWLKLINYLNVVEFVWIGFGDHTRQTSADYVPSEIQAAPAYMDVDTIVVLAAEAGCHTLTFEPESEYPLITGKNIQIRFWRDPFLGVVASFQNFASKKPAYLLVPQNNEFTFEWLASGLDRSHGKFQTKKLDHQSNGKPQIENRDQIHEKFQILCLEWPMGSPQPKNGYFSHDKVPKENHGNWDAFVNVLDSGSEILIINNEAQPLISGPALNMDFCEESSNNRHPCPHVGKLRICRCWALLLSLAKRHNFSWLLYAEPMVQRDVFPAKSAKVERTLGTVLIQGSFWSVNHLSDPWIFEKIDQGNNRDWKTFWTKAQTESPSSWKVFAVCLHFAVDVVAGKRSFFRLRASQRREFRKEMTEEMKRVDEEIKRIESDMQHAQCARVGIYIVSAALMMLEPYEGSLRKLPKETGGYLPATTMPADLKIGDTPRNIIRLLKSIKNEGGEPLVQLYRLFVGLFDDCWVVEVDILMQSLFDLPSTGSWGGSRSAVEDVDKTVGSPVELMAKKNAPLTELLIYRTILLATICLTSLDNSEVFERGIGSRIVPFL